MQAWIYLVVLVATIGVAVDASRLGARRGALGGGFLDMGPAGWFFACLLFWIVALPCYLAVRPKLVRQNRVSELAFAGAVPMRSGYPQPGDPAGYGPPTNPGWYPSPSGFGMRWWDGLRWTEHHQR